MRFNFDHANKPLATPGLYRITCLVSGKVYIGISHNLRRRAYEHANQGESAIGNAVRKYGCANFLFEPLLYSIDPSDTSFLPLLEAKKIAEYDSVKHGYNITEASGRVGPYGESFASKIRAAHARKTPAERSAIVRKAKAHMSAEHKSEVGRNNALSVGREVLSERMRLMRNIQSIEKRSSIGKKGGLVSNSHKTPEQIEKQTAILVAFTKNAPKEFFLDSYKKGLGKLSTSKLSEFGKKGASIANAKGTPEERSAMAKKRCAAAHASRTPAERVALAIKANKARLSVGSEQLSESARKSWETRRKQGNDSNNLKGRIFIHKNRVMRMVSPDSHIPDGWLLGRSPRP